MSIVPTATDIKVSVFNVTSIASGDLWKDLPWNNNSTSAVRYKDNPTPYGNISQTFNFTIPINWDNPFKTIAPYVVKE